MKLYFHKYSDNFAPYFELLEILKKNHQNFFFALLFVEFDASLSMVRLINITGFSVNIAGS